MTLSGVSPSNDDKNRKRRPRPKEDKKPEEPARDVSSLNWWARLVRKR